MTSLPPPDILATEAPIETLTSTSRTIANAALLAGWEVRATRALGPRVPRQVQQDVVRTASIAIVGKMAGWRFTATNTAQDGWDVTIYRPGWPPETANTVVLGRMLKAQTPAVIRGR